ncbi:hypothetical protein Tco_0435846 [Tanacetum coccineum]
MMVGRWCGGNWGCVTAGGVVGGSGGYSGCKASGALTSVLGEVGLSGDCYDGVGEARVRWVTIASNQSFSLGFKSRQTKELRTTYKRGLAFVKEQLVFYKNNKVILCEQLDVLKRDISYKDSEISMLKKEFQQPEFEGYGPKTSKSVSKDISNEVRESSDALLVEELVLDDKLEKKTVFPTVAKIEFVRPKQQEKQVRKSVRLTAITIKGKGWVIHKKKIKARGKAKGGRITGKGTLKTGNHDLEDV